MDILSVPCLRLPPTPLPHSLTKFHLPSAHLEKQNPKGVPSHPSLREHLRPRSREESHPFLFPLSTGPFHLSPSSSGTIVIFKVPLNAISSRKPSPSPHPLTLPPCLPLPQLPHQSSFLAHSSRQHSHTSILHGIRSS